MYCSEQLSKSVVSIELFCCWFVCQCCAFVFFCVASRICISALERGPVHGKLVDGTSWTGRMMASVPSTSLVLNGNKVTDITFSFKTGLVGGTHDDIRPVHESRPRVFRKSYVGIFGAIQNSTRGRDGASVCPVHVCPRMSVFEHQHGKYTYQHNFTS